MEATSTWTQDSYDDFVNGTLDKITIDNYGGDAQLRLNFSQEEEDGWVEKMPPIKPSRRFGHGFSPINGTDKVLLFGGWDTISFPSIVFNDTWVYDYSEDSWTNMFPTGENPPPSAYALMTPIYDTDKVFLVATTTSSMNPHRTWVYDLSDNNWTRKSDDVNAYAMTNRGGMASVFGTDKIIHVGEISPNYMTW